MIRRANTDTFHVTNRAPQIGYFNMGTRHKAEAKPKFHPGGDLHWRALEEFVLANARADKQRVTVFTGPVRQREACRHCRGAVDLAASGPPEAGGKACEVEAVMSSAAGQRFVTISSRFCLNAATQSSTLAGGVDGSI